MAELRDLINQLIAGGINHRRFIRRAVALGLSTAAAIAAARKAIANSHIGDFEDGKRGYPPLRRKASEVRSKVGGISSWNKDDPVDMYNYSIRSFKDAIKKAQAAGHPHWQVDAWLGYAYSLARSESWKFGTRNRTEHKWSPAQLKSQAEKLVDGAVEAAGAKDYDARWAQAMVKLNFGDPVTAKALFDNILADPNVSLAASRNRDFLFEMADACVHANHVDDAIVLCCHLDPVHDWHRHQLAWCLFVKAGKAPEWQKEQLYKAALQTLKNRTRRPAHERHLGISELLKAACQAKLGDTAKAQATLETRFRKHCNGKQNHKNFSTWGLAQARNYAPFAAPENKASDPRTNLGHWVDALKKAGLR